MANTKLFPLADFGLAAGEWGQYLCQPCRKAGRDTTATMLAVETEQQAEEARDYVVDGAEFLCGPHAEAAQQLHTMSRFRVGDLLINEYSSICQVESVAYGIVTLDWRRGIKTYLPVSHFEKSSFRLATLPEDKERMEFFYSQSNNI